MKKYTMIEVRIRIMENTTVVISLQKRVIQNSKINKRLYFIKLKDIVKILGLLENQKIKKNKKDHKRSVDKYYRSLLKRESWVINIQNKI